MAEPLEKGMITWFQAAMLFLLAVLPTSILFVPALTAAKSRQDGWLAMSLAAIAGLLLGWQLLAAVRCYPGQNLVQMLQTAFGRYLGKAFGLLLTFWGLLAAAAIVRQYAEFLVTTVMPETPIELILLVMILLTAWAISAGLEVMGRMAEFLASIIITALFLFYLFLVKDVELLRLLPVMEYGPGPVIAGAIVPASWLGEVIVLGNILPYLNRPAAAGRAVLGGMLLNGISLVFTIIIIIGLFGQALTANLLFPTFSAARQVSVGGFLENIEPLLIAVWLTGVFIKMTVFKYFAAVTAAQTLGLKNYRVLVFPLSMVAYAWSISLWENTQQLLFYLAKSAPVFSFLTVEGVLPLALLAAAFLRRN